MTAVVGSRSPGTRSPRFIFMLVKAPEGWAAARVTVSPRSAPPSVLFVERVSGAAPEKQASAVEAEPEPRVIQPTLQTCDSVQLFCWKRGPELHL